MTINISGKVIKGDGYGRKLGFPTANIDRKEYVRNKLKVKLGIWAGEVRIKIRNSKFEIYRGAVVIGPIDKKGLPKIEAHLIGFTGSLYGNKIEVSLQKYLRPFKKFSGESELKTQIKKDIKKVIGLISNGK